MTWLKQIEEVTGITNFLDFLTKYDLNPNNTKDLISMIYKVPFNKWSIGTFTRDVSTASGNQSVTGVGFTPKIIIMLGCIDGTLQVCFGFCDRFTNRDVGYHVSGGYWQINTSVLQFISTGSVFSTAVIATMDSDGFTLTWTKNGSHTGTATIYYLALR